MRLEQQLNLSHRAASLEIAEGRYKYKEQPEIKGTGYVVKSLNKAAEASKAAASDVAAAAKEAGDEAVKAAKKMAHDAAEATK